MAESVTALQAIGLFIVGGTVASTFSVFLWYRTRQRVGWGDALATASVPVCLYIAVALSVASVAVVSEGGANWDSARLTPSVMLARGHMVYSSALQGSVQTTMYPPVWVVSYLPASMGDTPVQVLAYGSALALLFAFVPVVMILVGGSARTSMALLGSAAFVVAAKSVNSLSYSLFRPHADAPSLGYAMLACALVLRPGLPSRSRMASVATLAWLSVLSKQVLLPLLIALPLWYLFVHGRKEAIRLVSWMGATGAVAIATVLIWFGPDGVLFNTVTIPSRVPWRPENFPRPLQLLYGLAELADVSMLLLLLVLAGAGIAVLLRADVNSITRNVGEGMKGSSWALPLLVALFMVPAAVLGITKIGGAQNSFSPVTYFLLAAGILAVLDIHARLLESAADRSREAGVALIVCCCLILAVGGAAKMRSHPPSLAQHPTQIAFEYLVQEDAGAFFPAHPLAHLLADGSTYHLAMALYEREHQAGLRVPDQQRRSHLPSEPTVVCWNGSYGSHYVRENYFTDYRKETTVGLPGPPWKCYAP